MTEKEFISGWISKLTAAGIKEFPGDFISSEETNVITLPGKTLILGEEFFGSFEILAVDGSSIYRAENYNEAKYIIYANRNRPKALSVPVSHDAISEVIVIYEKYLDSIIKEIDKNYKIEFPSGNNVNGVVNDIMRVLNLVRY